MAAELSDHYGAIPVGAFDADHPDRPGTADPDAVNDLAERRIWGSSTRVPGHPRRMAAVGTRAGMTYISAVDGRPRTDPLYHW